MPRVWRAEGLATCSLARSLQTLTTRPPPRPQGDRRAGPSLSEFNYESHWGQRALRELYRAALDDAQAPAALPPACRPGASAGGGRLGWQEDQTTKHTRSWRPAACSACRLLMLSAPPHSTCRPWRRAAPGAAAALPGPGARGAAGRRHHPPCPRGVRCARWRPVFEGREPAFGAPDQQLRPNHANQLPRSPPLPPRQPSCVWSICAAPRARRRAWAASRRKRWRTCLASSTGALLLAWAAGPRAGRSGALLHAPTLDAPTALPPVLQAAGAGAPRAGSALRLVPGAAGGAAGAGAARGRAGCVPHCRVAAWVFGARASAAPPTLLLLPAAPSLAPLKPGLPPNLPPNPPPQQMRASWM